MIIAALFLTACNTPSPAFKGLPMLVIKIDGSVFHIRQRGLRAEAIRINPAYAPRFGPLRTQAAIAMQMASGCKVVSISGDQAQSFGRLDCGNGPPPRLRGTVDFDCVPERGSAIREIGQIRISLDCDPV